MFGHMGNAEPADIPCLIVCLSASALTQRLSRTRESGLGAYQLYDVFA